MEEFDVNAKFLLNNDAGSILKIILEPWADEILVGKSDQIGIKIIGSEVNVPIELEYEGTDLIIYSPYGSLVYVSINEKPVYSASNNIRAI